MATKPTKCKHGDPCGYVCLPANKTCRLNSKTSKVLDNLVKGGTSATRVKSKEQTPKVLDELEAEPVDVAKRREIVKQSSLRLPPGQITAILNTPIDATGETIGEFHDKGKGVGVYDLPTMKRRTVSDTEVEAVWEAMTPDQQQLIFSANAGAPARGEGNRIRDEWNKDTELMRKSMLKAMMEQTDDNGDVIDPWTGKTLEFPADLDHIVPLKKGGGHGGKVSKEKTADFNTTITSDNWVWVKPEINRNYKGDSDLDGTIKKLKIHLAEGDDGYNKHLDEKIDEFEKKERPLLELQRGVENGLLAHFGASTLPYTNIQPKLPTPAEIDILSPDQVNKVFTALNEVGLIKSKSSFDGLKGDAKKAALKEVMKAAQEDADITIAKVGTMAISEKYDDLRSQGSGQTAKQSRIPSNKDIKGIVKIDSLDKLKPKQIHRVMDKFALFYGDSGGNLANSKMFDKHPAYIKSIITRIDKNIPPIPRSELSASPWSWARAGNKIPDLNAKKPDGSYILSNSDREKFYKYLQASFK